MLNRDNDPAEQNRILRRLDDPFADDEITDNTPLDSIAPFEEPEKPPTNRRFIIFIIIAFLVGCVLLASCLIGYSYLSQNNGPLPTTAVLDVQPSAQATQVVAASTNTPVPATAQPTVDTAATEAAALPAIRYATVGEIVGEVQIRAGAEGVWIPVTTDTLIGPGTSVLTGQNSRVRITTSEGNIIRLSSQTQLTITEAGGTDTDPINRMQMDFGKLWAVVIKPLGNGLLEIKLPVGVAAVYGSFMSAEYNSTTNGIVVSCLEGHCFYANDGGAAEMTDGQQAVSRDGAAPTIEAISGPQLTDWSGIPEITTLTPPATFTASATASRTPIPTRTPIPSRTTRPTNTATATRTTTSTPSASPAVSATATTPPSGNGQAAQLAFSIQPPNTTTDASFTVEISILDASGALVTNANNAVSLAFGSNNTGASLVGNATVGPQNGKAVFNIGINQPGAYTLVANSPDLASATSIEFQVNPPTNASVFIISGLPNEVSMGQAITITVTVREASGGVATNYLGTVHFQSSDGAANLPSDYSFTASDRGTRAFNLIFNSKGDQTIKVSDVGTPTLAGYAGTKVK